MPEPRISLQPENYYHIYNHAVGNENLFETDHHYQYFLEKLREYLVPVNEVFAYCLMPNHFHLVIRIKNETEIKKFLMLKYFGLINPDENITSNPYYLSDQLSRIYSNFFNTYSKHYNFLKNRNGSLFKRAFMRKKIEDKLYLKRLICYVHQNPVKAGLASKLPDWKYSSFVAIMSKRFSLVQRDEVLSLFGDGENLLYCHSQDVEI